MLAKLMWFMVLLGFLFGTFMMLGVLTADTAPQQAAGAAVACALVVLPYCAARAIEGFEQGHHRRQTELLETQTKLLASIANDIAERRQAP